MYHQLTLKDFLHAAQASSMSSTISIIIIQSSKSWGGQWPWRWQDGFQSQLTMLPHQTLTSRCLPSFWSWCRSTTMLEIPFHKSFSITKRLYRSINIYWPISLIQHNHVYHLKLGCVVARETLTDWRAAHLQMGCLVVIGRIPCRGGVNLDGVTHEVGKKTHAMRGMLHIGCCLAACQTNRAT